MAKNKANTAQTKAKLESIKMQKCACTAGMFGGVGTNALTLPYIIKNGYTKDLPLKMLETIAMLKNEQVDIHLGNHTENNNTLGKREKQLCEGGNPFIDRSGWTYFLDKLEQKVKSFISENGQLDAEYHALHDHRC